MLTRYARIGASSRIRMLQYVPTLEAHGFTVTIAPLLTAKYVSDLQSGCRHWPSVIKGYWQRMSILATAQKKFDLIWIEKDAFPWLPLMFEKMFYSNKVPRILDYDDAVFYQYAEHKNFFVRLLLKKKHRRLMSEAELVITGNEYLAAYARESMARVIILPSVVDLKRYPCININDSTKARAIPKIVWIGQKATSIFLQPYAELLQEIVLSGRAEIIGIGFDLNRFNIRSEYIPWSEENEVTALQNCDIGIMPLPDGLFEQGKCGYKLIQYMACQLPVVASPVGVNSSIVAHERVGFCAVGVDGWRQCLETLINDPHLRRDMGINGRNVVEKHYSTNVTAPVLVQLLAEIGKSQMSTL